MGNNLVKICERLYFNKSLKHFLYTDGNANHTGILKNGDIGYFDLANFAETLNSSIAVIWLNDNEFTVINKGVL